MNRRKKLLYIFIGLIAVVAVAAFGFALGSSFFFPAGGWNSFAAGDFIKNINLPKAYIVQSGSMEPAVKLGSIVVSIPQKAYWQGDIVTFSKDVGGKNPITHRILAKTYPNGIEAEPVYKTGGDANENFDTGEVINSQIVGKVVLSVPYFGYLADFAKKPWGFILLVIAPAIIIIYEELKNLLKEIIKLFLRLKERLFTFKGLPLQGGRTSLSKGLPKLSILLPIFGAFLVLVSLTASFFSDTETAIGNLFQAWTSTPTPTPPPTVQTLVINEVLPDSSCTVGEGPITPRTWALAAPGYPNVFTSEMNAPLVGSNNYYLGVAWDIPDTWL